MRQEKKGSRKTKKLPQKFHQLRFRHPENIIQGEVIVHQMQGDPTTRYLTSKHQELVQKYINFSS